MRYASNDKHVPVASIAHLLFFCLEQILWYSKNLAGGVIRSAAKTKSWNFRPLDNRRIIFLLDTARFLLYVHVRVVLYYVQHEPYLFRAYEYCSSINATVLRTVSMNSTEFLVQRTQEDKECPPTPAPRGGSALRSDLSLLAERDREAQSA